MSRLLRHVPTGDLYIFTDILAKRPDMELVPDVEPAAEPVAEVAVEEPVEPVAPVVEKKVVSRKKKEVQSAEALSIDVED